VILGLLQEAQDAGARLEKACEVLELDPRTIQRWRCQDGGEDQRAGPRERPGNQLSPAEREEVLEVVNSPEYRDVSPKQIVPQLADQGVYVASESTMYRILREEGQMQHREASRPPHGSSKPPEQVATGPNQVWSWDITYLLSPIRGVFLYLYLVVTVHGFSLDPGPATL
jgi:transposase